MSAPHLTVIAGPTASGKTRRAVALAQRLGAEIVSADSQQVYRHFDLGTAKPSREEQAAVPHHLISFVEPTQTFSAAEYQAKADEAIAAIHARGKRVIVVGGTGLYLRVLLHGVVPAPPADAALRAELTKEAEEHGRAHVHAKLAQVDPVTAARLSPNDLVRVIRALEIHTLTGRPPSALHQAHAFAQERYPFELFVLTPERQSLYAAIAERTRAIYAAGLVDETRALVAQGFRDTAPMRSVGYAQALGVVEGRLSEAEAEALTLRETRRYAKRQGTWFRKETGAKPIQPPYEELSFL